MSAKGARRVPHNKDERLRRPERNTPPVPSLEAAGFGCGWTSVHFHRLTLSPDGFAEVLTGAGNASNCSTIPAFGCALAKPGATVAKYEVLSWIGMDAGIIPFVTLECWNVDVGCTIK